MYADKSSQLINVATHGAQAYRDLELGVAVLPSPAQKADRPGCDTTPHGGRFQRSYRRPTATPASLRDRPRLPLGYAAAPQNRNPHPAGFDPALWKGVIEYIGGA